MVKGIYINITSKIFSKGNNSRQNHEAIKNLKINISKGEFCTIIGPSGCGKTTLLNLVAGLDTDMHGEIFFGNKKKVEQIRTAYMFQTPRLLPWLNVLENVKVVLNKDQKSNKRAEAILSIMGLKNFLNYYPNQISGGMQRRVALARSFSSQPELFLLDEPFVSLDDQMANKLRDMLLKQWTNEPTTIIFVTHDLREAIYLSDRIIFLSKPPSRVILDTRVDIRRPRNVDNKEIEIYRKKILKKTQDFLKEK